MATKIITKNSSTATSIPTAGDLVQGELAVNVTDKRLFTEDNGGAIVELGTNPSTLTSGAATFSGYVDVSGANPANTLLGQVSVKSTTALANGNASGISFWANTSTGLGAYASIQTVTTGDYAGKLVFTTRNGAGVFDPRMTIDASGNLLVGKTAVDFSIDGVVAQPSGVVGVTRNGGAPLILNRKTSDGDIAIFQKDGAPVGVIGAFSGVPYIGYAGGTGGGIMFNGLSIQPTALGSARTNGTNDIGSSFYRWKDLYLSGGVYLGGTGAANKLDDYEEGLHDIVLTPSTSGSLTVGGTSNAVAYTKVGQLVTITGNITVIGVSSPVGQYVDISLPFAISSKTDQAERFGSAFTYFDSSSSIFSTEPMQGIAGSVVRMQKDAATWAVSDQVYLSFSYTTDL